MTGIVKIDLKIGKIGNFRNKKRILKKEKKRVDNSKEVRYYKQAVASEAAKTLITEQ